MSSKTLSKLAISFVVLAFSCSKEPTQNGSTPVGLPTIQIPEGTFDFGNVTEGGKLTHVFTIKNVGLGVLHVDQVKTSCGCTAAILKNKEIPPGGEGQVEVTFDTSHRGGDQRKTIGVVSDDPVKPTANLEIHANVEVLLAFEPDFAQLRTEVGKDQVFETWLTGKLKESARLKVVVKPAEPELTVKVVEKSLEGGAVVQGLKYTLTTKKSGFGSGSVSVETGLPNPDKLQPGYSWNVAGNFDVAPVELLFSNGPGDSPERVLHVTGKNPGFKVREARIVKGPFVARLETPDSGTGYEVRVSLKKDAKFPPEIVAELGKLELVSNDPLEPRKEVKLKFSPTFVPSQVPGAAIAVPGRPSEPLEKPQPNRRR